MEFIWGLAIGLLAEMIIHLSCDFLGRKAGKDCGFDCENCKAGKTDCTGYYCYKQRHNADVTNEGE